MSPKHYIISVLFAALAPATVFADNYIVVLKSSAVKSNLNATLTKEYVINKMMMSLAKHYRLKSPSRVFSVVLEGGVYDLTEKQADKLSQDARVDYIEKDKPVYAISNQSRPESWGLDRIDQFALPLNQLYSYPSNGGSQVNVYVIDTGVLMTHEQFQGRAVSGLDTIDNDYDSTDCYGHGTHVAGTIGGYSYGVAKNTTIYAVRVLDCHGGGTDSGVVAGVEWVTRYHRKPAVANMSLGGSPSTALDNAIKNSIRAGVTYVVAAGNDSLDACNYTPARVSTAITVGSTTDTDMRSYFSNYGTCVSLFAPGSEITSAWIDSNYSTNTISGTSMATPHVAGAAALYLSQYPNATPAQVKTALKNAATANRIFDVGAGSPNLLLNTQFLGTATH